MQTRTAAHLARRERHTYERKDKCRHRVGITAMTFHLDDIYRVGTLVALLTQKIVQLADLHRRYDLIHTSQLAHVDIYQRIQISQLLERLRPVSFGTTHNVTLSLPTPGSRIDSHVRGLK